MSKRARKRAAREAWAAEFEAAEFKARKWWNRDINIPPIVPIGFGVAAVAVALILLGLRGFIALVALVVGFFVALVIMFAPIWLIWRGAWFVSSCFERWLLKDGSNENE